VIPLTAVRIECRTNLDEYKREEWPRVAARAPNLGETIEATSGKWLRIVQITHATHSSGEPLMKLELHR
jgi:hypothetical protein